MITAGDIYGFIDELAPYSLQESYDNSGLNVGDPDCEVKKILVALDVTKEVCEEAAETSCDMVLAHHPVIFHGLKTLDPKNPAVMLAKNGICALSMHTNFDSARGGMNDLLCESLGLIPKESLAEEHGVSMGYICECEPIRAAMLAALAKERLGCKAVRYCHGESTVTRVGICGGSGGSLMRNALARGCQALITGDVKHDVFIDAHNAGLAVIDAGHYYTENIFFEFIKEKLSEKFHNLEINEAKSNIDVTECL